MPQRSSVRKSSGVTVRWVNRRSLSVPAHRFLSGTSGLASTFEVAEGHAAVLTDIGEPIEHMTVDDLIRRLHLVGAPATLT